MNLASIHQFTLKYGGPWKLLLMSMRGGQFIGAILALGSYAWIISFLTSDGLSVLGGLIAIEVIAVCVTLYTALQHPATWYYFEATWFSWGSIICDAIGVGGSIAVAVLTSGTADCSGIFKQGERGMVGSSDAQQACKLQKAVFATGIMNSLMFSVTLCIQAWLIYNLRQTREPEDTIDELSIGSPTKLDPSPEVKEA